MSTTASTTLATPQATRPEIAAADVRAVEESLASLRDRRRFSRPHDAMPPAYQAASALRRLQHLVAQLGNEVMLAVAELPPEARDLARSEIERGAIGR